MLFSMPGFFHGGAAPVPAAVTISLRLADIYPLLQHAERQNRFGSVYRVVDAEFSG